MAALRSLLRGLGLGVAMAAVVLALQILVGAVVPNPGLRYVSLAGAAGGVLFGLLGGQNRALESAGAGLIGLGAIVVGFGGEWNVILTSAVSGAVSALLWILAGEPRLVGWWRWFRWGGLVLPLVIVLVLPLITGGGILGHDESAYAVKARQWLEGTPGTGWSSHRGPAMSALAYPLLALGGAEPDLRLIGLVGGLGLIVSTWALAARLSNPVAAALAAAGVAASPAVLYRSTEYLSDIPAAALLVVCMIVVWREFGDEAEPSFRLIWVVLPALAAFYLRYQSILSIGLILVVIPVLWWGKIRARPGPLLATLGVGLIGMVPHLIQAVVMEGAPWGLVTITADAAGREFLGEGLVDYFVQARWPLGAFVAPIAIVAALLGLLFGWGRIETRARLLFLLVPSGLQVIALGLVAHGEPRFIIFPLALVVVAGAITIHAWLATDRRPAAIGVAWGLGVLLVGSLGFAASYARDEVQTRSATFAPLQEAMSHIEATAEGAPCGVLTTYAPQVTFYTRCVTRVFPDDPTRAVDLPPGDERFVLLVDPGVSQPSGQEREALLELTVGPEVFDGRWNQVTVARFEG